MATIGLYDIDFNHGANFSLSLPLMKSYNKLRNEGHQVIMMKPYEDTGRFNKIFYFKDNPNLIVPSKLKISDKGSMHGYGFYGTSMVGLETKIMPPSFEPYLLHSDRIKNKTLFNSIKNNSIIDWREKDFTGAIAGAGITYVNDRNFLGEEDWEELFNHYDNNIEFVHSIKCSDYEQACDFLNLYKGNKSKIIVPYTLKRNEIAELTEHRCVYFDSKDKTNTQLFLLIFAAKTFTENKIYFSQTVGDTQFKKYLFQWAQAGRISFKDFLGDKFKDEDYLKFPYRILLKQNPTKITYNELVDYLTFEV